MHFDAKLNLSTSIHFSRTELLCLLKERSAENTQPKGKWLKFPAPQPEEPKVHWGKMEKTEFDSSFVGLLYFLLSLGPVQSLFFIFSFWSETGWPI